MNLLLLFHLSVFDIVDRDIDCHHTIPSEKDGLKAAEPRQQWTRGCGLGAPGPCIACTTAGSQWVKWQGECNADREDQWHGQDSRQQVLQDQRGLANLPRNCVSTKGHKESDHGHE